MASINVKLKNASGDVLYPKTLWSNIEGKPSFHFINIRTESNTECFLLLPSEDPAILHTANDLYQSMNDYMIYPAWGTWFETSGSYTYIILGIFVTSESDEFTLIGRKVGANLNATTVREPFDSVRVLSDHVIF